jgi:membrane-associated phospholipid phosphatase
MRSGPLLKHTVRLGAAACIAAAFAVPLVRRRRKVPAPVTVAVCAAGPLAVSVLWPRSRRRDVALFAMQMWGFMIAHELPYDDPERLRERLRIRYTIDSDRAIGRGVLPNTRLQRLLAGRSKLLDRVLVWTHWLWFLEPYVTLIYILVRHTGHFPRAARQMAAVFDIGCAVYMALPTAPPWWAAENGYTGDDEVRRIMIDIGEQTWGPAWPRMYGTLGSNPWAAMPSLHFATSLLAAILLAETGKVEGVLGSAYAATLGFALVYLGEHYVTDLLAGTALVLAVRYGEPLAEPLVLRINRGLQRLEAIATG